MDDDDDSIGWGRPRPKFSDLLHSTPEHSDDDDVQMEVDMTDNSEERPRPIPRNNIFTMENVMESSNHVAPLIDYPLHGYAGAPCGELNQKYTNEGLTQAQAHSLKNYYTIWDNGKNSPHTRFTCIFTCPVTGEHFAAGNWENEKGVTIVTIIDEVCWYTTKKIAKIAAAARALDCFSLRRCHGTKKSPFPRCIDSPYLSAGNAPKLPDLPSVVVLPIPFSHGGDGKQQDVVIPPKQALNEWYTSFSKKLQNVGIVVDEGIGPQKECYSSWSNRKGSPDTLFTAIFTCHLTGERFASGKLVGEEAHEEDYWYFDCESCTVNPREIPEEVGDECNSDEPSLFGDDDVVVQKEQHEPENRESDDDASLFGTSDKDEDDEDGEKSSQPELCNELDHLGLQKKIHFIWYKTKKQAITAAAGRAIDCLRHRGSHNDTISDKRYCKELPYTVENTPEIWKLVSESAQRVGDAECPPLPYEDRLTTWFGVPDLHSLLEEEHDEEYWRERYREARHAGESGT
mmetsp:Transcript_23026/g.49842  ORF Transcript_23026/g.49842 Transcript_23026/m.49842 type:complete len:514 (-) Transcript_23026:67-1608(-)